MGTQTIPLALPLVKLSCPCRGGGYPYAQTQVRLAQAHGPPLATGPSFAVTTAPSAEHLGSPEPESDSAHRRCELLGRARVLIGGGGAGSGGGARDGFLKNRRVSSLSTGALRRDLEHSYSSHSSYDDDGQGSGLLLFALELRLSSLFIPRVFLGGRMGGKSKKDFGC